MTDSGRVYVLITQLRELGVDLPDHLASSADQILRLPSLRPQPLRPAEILGLSDAQLTATVRELGVGYALDGSSGPGAQAIDALTQWLSEAVAEGIAAIADDVLDQLRPRFDEAAAVVHNATELGITGTTTDRDILKSDDVAAVRDAWTSIPAASRMLDAIAAARIELTEVAGAPPGPLRAKSFGAEVRREEWAGALFRDDAPTWRQDFEATWQMWLRLSAGRPVELLPTTTSIEAFGLVKL